MVDFGWDDMGTYLTTHLVTKEKIDAIQKLKPAGLPVRKQTEGSEGVRKQDSEGSKTPQEDPST